MNAFLEKAPWPRLLLLAVLCLIAYSNTFDVPFHFDDLQNIKDNPELPFSELTMGSISAAAFNGYCTNRPVANITFALNRYFHGDDLFGYHAVNLIIHLTTGVLLFFLVNCTLSLPSVRRPGQQSDWIAFFSALLWLVNPIQTQSVTYIVQRMNSMAAMFYILSLLLYVQGRLTERRANRRLLFGASAAAGLLALGSKEYTVTLPFFILLYEWFFFQDLSRQWFKRRVPYMAVALVILGVLVFVYLGKDPVQALLWDYKRRPFTPIERVLTELRVVIFYVSLLLFPHPSRLSLEHDFPLSHSFFSPITTLLSAVVIASLVAISIYLARRDRVLSFCILWYFGHLIVESSVIGLEIIFEHRTYLPSMFVSVLIVLLADRLVEKRGLVVGAFAVIAVVFVYWTYDRNKVWQDPVVFWADCVKKGGSKPRPHYNLGFTLTSLGRSYEAIAHYMEALRIKPDYPEAHNNLGALLALQGKIDDAIGHYQKALTVKPRYLDAYNNLGGAYAQKGDLDEAIRYFEKALEIEPEYASAHANLGLSSARKGDLDAAIAHFQEALRINPEHVEAHNNLGVALAARGAYAEAVKHYEIAVRLRPDYADGHKNLAEVLARQGALQQAKEHFQRVLQIDPNCAEAHNGLGIVLAAEHDFNAAVMSFKAALKINPGYASARKNLKRAQALQK